MITKQGALFQEIHPADVQKNHQDNIFDYRLHMKLGRGEQVFKVQQVKRKQKKKPVGKQCQCCGRQFSKYHKCSHTICQRKCGKPSLKKSQSRRDISSMYSDSKDENWSQQNYDEDKTIRGKNQRKFGRVQQSSSSNKQGYNNGDPCDHLLQSIEKLITEKVLNNFSYKVIQIKQFEQQQESAKDQEEQEDLYDESIDGNNSNHIIYTSQNDHPQFKENFGLIQKKVQSEKTPFLVQKLGQSSNNQKYSKNIRFQEMQHHKNQEQLQINQQKKSEINQQENNIQKKQIESLNAYLLNPYGKNEKMQLQNQENICQNQLQEVQGQNQDNKAPQNSQKEEKNNQSNKNNKINQNQVSMPISSINHKMLSSDSESSSQHIEQLAKDLPQEAIIPMNEEDQDDLVLNKDQNNLFDSQPDIQSQEKQNQSQKQNDVKDDASLPDYKSDSDSFDDEIYDIQQQNPPNPNQDQKILPINKISKKLSKQLKIIEKQKLRKIQNQKLKSQNIQEIQPNIQIQLTNQTQKITPQNQNQSIQLPKKHGKGKGKGMGQGYGIFQEQLDIYSENSSLLEQKNLKQKPQQIFQKLEQKPLTKSFNSIEMEKLNLDSKSSISYQPGTPRRKIPNMEKIIEKMKIQSQNVEEWKGLGRGKIFGRGLGVLAQTQQIEKQLEKDDYLIEEGKSGDKKVKVDEMVKKGGEYQKDKNKENMIREQNDQMQRDIDQYEKKVNKGEIGFEEKKVDLYADKFDELIEQQGDRILIEEQIEGIQIVRQNGNKGNKKQIYEKQENEIEREKLRLNKQIQSINQQKQKMQEQESQQDISVKSELNYISYLNKKETLLHPQIIDHYPSSEDIDQYPSSEDIDQYPSSEDNIPSQHNDIQYNIPNLQQNAQDLEGDNKDYSNNNKEYNVNSNNNKSLNQNKDKSAASNKNLEPFQQSGINSINQKDIEQMIDLSNQLSP